MRTELIRIDAADPDPDAIARAAHALRSGALVAFPTETVYGLGALADDAAAIERIYRAKGRPAHNPLIAHVPGEPEARAAAAHWPAVATELARAFWPGPLTLVVPRASHIPAVLSAGLDTVALRSPRHPVALALLRAVGRPVAAPSANPSNSLSPTRAEHVLKGLDGRLEMVLDAGPCALGIESTVIDLAHDRPRILRHGSLSLAQLRTVVPDLDDLADVPGQAHASPGMDRKHYAPRARLQIVARASLASAARRAVPPVGVIVRGNVVPALDAIPAHVLSLPDDAEAFGAGLFDSLHALDDLGCATVLVEAVPDDVQWAAIRDRLGRASAE